MITWQLCLTLVLCWSFISYCIGHYLKFKSEYKSRCTELVLMKKFNRYGTSVGEFNARCEFKIGHTGPHLSKHDGTCEPIWWQQK